MNETQQRIKAYQEALPGLKERVAAVALLLVLSLVMLTSASFAWLTISRAPEVSGVNTTVAANGNLEIALASGDGKIAPGESKVGDSSAAKGQNIRVSNLTWGNLVNLGDPSYGLENLTLRPAQLNMDDLQGSPLYGAVYTGDGRVEMLTSNFAYTSWVPPADGLDGYFTVAEAYGVRAISSTAKEDVGQFALDYDTLKTAANGTNRGAANAFEAITGNTVWMDSLATMIGTHMTARLNGEDRYKNAVANPGDLQNLIDMYSAFLDAFALEADALANQLNFQLFLAYGGDTTKYTPYTGTSLRNLTANSGKDLMIQLTDALDAEGNPKVVKITNFKTFISDYKLIETDKVHLEAIQTRGDLRWTNSGVDGTVTNGLSQVINRLVDINKCVVDGPLGPKTVSELLTIFTSGIDGMSKALKYKDKECDTIITNGVLYNFEQRVGTDVVVTRKNSNGLNGLPVVAKMYVDTMNLGEQVATIYATITTSATKPSEFSQDMTYAEGLYTGASADIGVVTAKDTYGMAIDVWVRTNAAHSYLMLEGNVLTETETVPATGKDATGTNDVELYTLTRSETIEVPPEEEGGESTTQTISTTYDLYKVEEKDENGTVTSTTWYNAKSHSPFTLNEGESPTQKMVDKVTVIGYEGENRVWEESQYFPVDDSYISTTQGNGSCYVYYASTPEDQERSLKLLEALKVAFIDQNGQLLATGEMDTKHRYATPGRVTVPLVLSAGSDTITTEDSNGFAQETRVITALEKNTPLCITAIVYLDGSQLTNDEVLAASDIQGQLNIQFGSTQALEPIDDETLASAARKVSATAAPTTFDYDTATEAMTTTVSVMVDGEQPNEVTAYFVRKINETQGIREDRMTFSDDDGDGTWTATHTFTVPGNYILRTVQLDGVDYTLDESALPTVTVNGFNIAELNIVRTDGSVTGNNVTIMTAEKSCAMDLSLKFATSDLTKMPQKVQGRFLREDGTAVNVNFTLDPTSQIWSGSATFLSSGYYTMEYLVLDGEYVPLASGHQKTADVSLGMKVRIYTTSPTSFKYVPSEMTDAQKLLGMQVTILNDANQEITGRPDAKLTYNMEGSAASKMDTDLRWNPAEGYYEGELRTLESGGPGNWKFSTVTVGGNTITNATTAPVFSIISPEPPSYAGIGNKADYQFVPTGGATMEAKIDYSTTAKVMAVITDASGNEYWAAGTNPSTAGNTTTWKFAIPTKSGKQDGRWTMKKIYVWNYFDAAGEYITADYDTDTGLLTEDADLNSIMCIDMSKENYTTKVVQTIHVSFAANQSKDFGKSGETVTGTFMQEHTISSLNVDIKDFEGAALQNIGEVKLSYVYQNDAQAKGGYTSTALNNAAADFTIDLTADDTGKHFVQSGNKTIQYAGTYLPKLSFKVGTQPQSYGDGSTMDGLPANTPQFTVWSVKPSVKITATTPKAGASVKVDPSGTSSHTTVTVPGSTSYEATVYFTCSADKAGDGSTCDPVYHNYTRPSVTLTLSDIGNAAAATMDFGTDVHVYNGTTKVTGYSWSAEGACPRNIGYFNSRTMSTDTKTAAGTLTASKLVLTYGGNVYEVTVPTITIKNPY